MGANIRDAQGERVVIGYVVTGDMPDGTPAVKRIDERTVRYLERDVGTGVYFTYELNCRTGEGRPFSAGSLAQQKVLTGGQSFNINDFRVEVLPAYKEVCREAGMSPMETEKPSVDKPKKKIGKPAM